MKSTILNILWIITLAGAMASCEKENQEDLTRKVVLEAYIFEGEPVDDIHVSQMILFGGTDTVAKPINDATVRIVWNGGIYQLEPNGGDTGIYHYTGTDLTIAEGQTYRLEVDYFDKTAVAETTVPPKPQNFTITKDTLNYPEFNLGSIFDTTNVGDANDSIVMEWTEEPTQYFYLVVQNIDSNPESILPEWVPIETVNFFIYSQPFQDSRYVIGGLDFTHFGNHEYALYRINQEYVDLFESLNQDSRTLNEPKTNVTDGLGVFTSFNGAKGIIYVNKI